MVLALAIAVSFPVTANAANNAAAKTQKVIFWQQQFEPYQQTWFKKYVDNPDIDLPRDLIWVMPMCGSRKELLEVGPAVADICKKHNLKFSNRMHLQLWNLALKV